MGKHGLDWQVYEVGGYREVGTLGCEATSDLFSRWYRHTGKPGTKPRSRLVYFHKRLAEFKRFGYIDSIPIVFNSPSGPKKLPDVVRLLPKGADVIEDLTGVRPARPALSDPPTARTADHRAGVTRDLLSLLDSAKLRGLPPFDIKLEQDRVPGSKSTDPAHEQYVLREVFEIDGKRTVVRPDYVLDIPMPDGKHRLCAYGEHDRGTETEKDFVSKHANGGYAALLDGKHQRFRRHAPDATFARVFVVVPGPKRRDNILRWIKDRPGSLLYRVAITADVHDPAKVLTAPIWHRLDGPPVPIFAL